MMYFIDEQPIDLPNEDGGEETAPEETTVEETSIEDPSAEDTSPEAEDSASEESVPEVEDSTVEEDAPQMEEEGGEETAAGEETTAVEPESEPAPEEISEEESDEETAAVEELTVEETASEAEEPAVEETVEPASESSSKEPVVEEEEDDGRLWFVIHCYSGYENKVRHNLEQRIESMNMKDFIFDVVVPIEEEIEVKDGKRKTVERRVFPGYILVNMIMNEESWYVVRNTPGVTSFVGMGNEPIPLRKEEVDKIIKRMEADAPRIRLTFRKGERVRITDGPFNEFRGTVDEIDMDRAKVRVMVNFFGRNTPVELDFLQVEKA